MRNKNIVTLVISTTALLISLAALITTIVLNVNRGQLILRDVIDMWNIEAVSVSLVLHPDAENVDLDSKEIALVDKALGETLIKKINFNENMIDYSYSLSIKSGNETKQVKVWGKDMIEIGGGKFYSSSGNLWHTLNQIFDRYNPNKIVLSNIIDIWNADSMQADLIINQEIKTLNLNTQQMSSVQYAISNTLIERKDIENPLNYLYLLSIKTLDKQIDIKLYKSDLLQIDNGDFYSSSDNLWRMLNKIFGRENSN